MINYYYLNDLNDKRPVIDYKIENLSLIIAFPHYFYIIEYNQFYFPTETPAIDIPNKIVFSERDGRFLIGIGEV